MKKVLIIFLTVTIFYSFGVNNKIYAENGVNSESNNKKYQCSFDDFENAVDEFFKLVEKKDYNALLQLVVLPIPGTEWVVNRYGNKGISEEEFKNNYEKIFNSEIIEKIKSRDFELSAYELHGVCKASITLYFQFENSDSTRIFYFELIDGKYRLNKIETAG